MSEIAEAAADSAEPVGQEPAEGKSETVQAAGQVEGAAREAQGAGVPGAGMVARAAKVGGKLQEKQDENLDNAVSRVGWGAAIMTTIAVVAAFALGFGPVAMIAMGMAGAAAGAAGGAAVAQVEGVKNTLDGVNEVKGAAAGLATDIFVDQSGQTGDQVEQGVDALDGASKGKAKESGDQMVQESRSNGVEPQAALASPSSMKSPSAGGVKAPTQSIGLAA